MKTSSDQRASECFEKQHGDVSNNDRVPGYELLETIGEGGFSLVYRAKQKSTGQIVAIKVLRVTDGHDSPHYQRNIERFEREVLLCAGMQHPNIVKILDKGEMADKRLFAVFEYVPGQTLTQYIRSEGAMTASEAGHIMAQVLDALACAHRQGVVHRDLKPQNIMVATSGANTQIKILDFGIGTIVSQSRPADFLTLTRVRESLGTPSYSAPEQLRGDPATIQTDLYAWGLVFLECLIGEPVMQGASAAEIYHKQLSAQEVPVPPALIGHPLASILRRVLKKKPTERCVDAESLWRELSEINLADIVGQVQSQGGQYIPGNEATVINSGAFREKRQITVLCCSVSVVPSFNEASQEHDIEALEILQQEQFNQCRDIATRFGGEIAGCLADRMLVYFGYPHASDTDVRRAARTALEINRVMKKRRALQFAAQDGLQLHTRAGIHTGLMVIYRDEMPQGHIANIAMRLESEAPVGGILSSESSYRCLKRHITFEKNEHHNPASACLAVQTWLLMGQRHSDSHDFLSEQSTVRQFVGNHQQLEWIRRRWNRVANRLGNTSEKPRGESTDGKISSVLIQGEAGIGKSRLLKELFSVVHNQGHHVYVCRCLPEYRNNGLFPFLELIRQLLDISESTPESVAVERIESEFAQAGCNVEHVVPVLCTWLSLANERYPALQVSPQRQKAWLLQAIIDWLMYLSREQALLFVVEDLHWIDPTSLQLLNKLFSQASAQVSDQPPDKTQSKALLLVMTARPEFKPPTGDECNESWVGKVDVIRVNRLERTDTETLVHKLTASRKLHSDVMEKIISSTDGVPLFVEELTQMLLANHLFERNGIWQLKNSSGLNEIPLTLRDLLIGRLDNLAEARETAQIAASIGREFDYELLAGTGFKSREDLACDIATLVKSELVYRLTKGDKNLYAFRHSLIRDAAYEAMLTDTREQIHRQIAFALKTDFTDRIKSHPEEIAEHYSLGGMPEKSSQYFIEAARLAASIYSNQEALNFYSRAIEDINKVDRAEPAYDRAITAAVKKMGGEAYEGAGDSAGLVGRHSRARQAFNCALNLNMQRVVQGGSETRARILRKIAKSWEISHEHGKSLLLYQQSEDSLGEFSAIMESRELLSEWLKISSGKLYVNYWDNNYAAMKKILDTVKPVVMQRGNRRQQAAVILDELLFTYRETRYKLDDKTVNRAHELVDIARRCDDFELMVQAQHELGLCLLFSRRYEESQCELETAVKLSKTIDDTVLQCRNLTYLAVAHRMLGQIEAVERTAKTAFEIAERISMSDYIGAAQANLAWVAWRRENYIDASHLAEKGIAVWHSLESRYPYPFQWLGLLVVMAIKLENHENIAEESVNDNIREYMKILLNKNQQLLPVEINQSLLNSICAEEVSVSFLRSVVDVAICESLL